MRSVFSTFQSIFQSHISISTILIPFILYTSTSYSFPFYVTILILFFLLAYYSFSCLNDSADFIVACEAQQFMFQRKVNELKQQLIKRNLPLTHLPCIDDIKLFDQITIFDSDQCVEQCDYEKVLKPDLIDIVKCAFGSQISFITMLFYYITQFGLCLLHVIMLVTILSDLTLHSKQTCAFIISLPLIALVLVQDTKRVIPILANISALLVFITISIQILYDFSAQVEHTSVKIIPTHHPTFTFSSAITFIGLLSITFFSSPNFLSLERISYKSTVIRFLTKLTFLFILTLIIIIYYISSFSSIQITPTPIYSLVNANFYPVSSIFFLLALLFSFPFQLLPISTALDNSLKSHMIWSDRLAGDNVFKEELMMLPWDSQNCDQSHLSSYFDNEMNASPLPLSTIDDSILLLPSTPQSSISNQNNICSNLLTPISLSPAARPSNLHHSIYTYVPTTTTPCSQYPHHNPKSYDDDYTLTRYELHQQHQQHHHNLHDHFFNNSSENVPFVDQYQKLNQAKIEEQLFSLSLLQHLLRIFLISFMLFVVALFPPFFYLFFGVSMFTGVCGFFFLPILSWAVISKTFKLYNVKWYPYTRTNESVQPFHGDQTIHLWSLMPHSSVLNSAIISTPQSPPLFDANSNFSNNTLTTTSTLQSPTTVIFDQENQQHFNHLDCISESSPLLKHSSTSTLYTMDSINTHETYGSSYVAPSSDLSSETKARKRASLPPFYIPHLPLPQSTLNFTLDKSNPILQVLCILFGIIKWWSLTIIALIFGISGAGLGIIYAMQYILFGYYVDFSSI